MERFYAKMKEKGNEEAPSYGLNSKLTKRNGEMIELVWAENGMYGEAIREISSWLRKAQKYAENEQQRHVIDLLLKYYHTGDLAVFDRYSIAWVEQQEGMVDFVNGFIEVYGDPLALKGTLSNMSALAVLISTGNCSRCLSAQLHLGSTL